MGEVCRKRKKKRKTKQNKRIKKHYSFPSSTNKTGFMAVIWEAVLEVLGRPVYVGSSGCGQLSKLANQGIVAVTIGAVAEAMLLLERGGADTAAVRTALRGGFADSTILQQHGERMTTGNFIPGGPSKFQLKDLDNVMHEAKKLNLSLPIIKHIQNRFAYLVETMEGGDKDHSALYLELLSHNH